MYTYTLALIYLASPSHGVLVTHSSSIAYTSTCTHVRSGWREKTGIRHANHGSLEYTQTHTHITTNLGPHIQATSQQWLPATHKASWALGRAVQTTTLHYGVCKQLGWCILHASLVS